MLGRICSCNGRSAGAFLSFIQSFPIYPVVNNGLPSVLSVYNYFQVPLYDR
ncbi:hypothetical protein JB92DRAFT_3064469 [Gautieria morchelliformis]|nr:hypothetical protein JB92DRAFT_3064469 [Gautieria morchelliformis]